MHRILLLLVFLSAIACNAGAACHPSFDAFIRQFEGDASFQLSHTQFPLKLNYVDQDEMEKRQRSLGRNDFKKQLQYPSLAEQRKLKAKPAFIAGKPGQCTVSFSVPDSDMYSITFKFSRQAENWQLVEIDDDSL